MPTILLISGPALGHFGRIALVARSLRDLVDCTIEIVIPATAKFDIARFDDEFSIRRVPIAERDLDYPAPAFAVALDAAFEAVQPDLVAHDCCPVRWLATTRFPDCPRAIVTNGFLTRLAARETVQTRLFRRRARLIRRERVRRGLPPLANGFDLYEADRVLLADPAWLVPDTGPLPETYRACGAVWWEAGGDLGEAMAGAQDILLCSMGSTGKLVDDRFCALAAERFGCEDIVRVHSKGEGETVRSIGGHRLFEAGILPLGRLLPQARAVMTQGGAGSSYQALAAGKPLMVVPSHPNQRILGELLQQRGVAITVESRRSLARIPADHIARIAARAAEAGPAHVANDGAPKIARHLVELLPH
ncbi:glycosyltransferase [Qipengyuania mesophila]|uniref:glycosyltransferase n=1 Tax=Qipengyuania mesophila TaxID=2867246 RepID=UPI0035595382